MCYKKGDSLCVCGGLIPILILVLIFWEPEWARTGIIVLAILGVIKAFTPCCCKGCFKTPTSAKATAGKKDESGGDTGQGSEQQPQG